MIELKTILDFLDTEKIEYRYLGVLDVSVEGFSSLARYNPSTLTWIKTLDNIPEGFNTSDIRLAIVTEGVEVDCNCIIAKESKRAFFSVLEKFWGGKVYPVGVGNGTFIGPDVVMGKDVSIGCNTTIDGNIVIGDDVIIGNNVTIYGKVSIGNHCEIMSGSTIGNDGVAFTRTEEGQAQFVRHFGGVQIGDHSRIYSNVVINRGVIDDTVIGRNVVISPNSMIGSNCIIGNSVTMTPACTLCGSVTIGDNTYISGATIKNQCHIGNNVFVGLGSVVTSDIKDDENVIGYPAKRTFILNKG